MTISTRISLLRAILNRYRWRRTVIYRIANGSQHLPTLYTRDSCLQPPIRCVVAREAQLQIVVGERLGEVVGHRVQRNRLDLLSDKRLHERVLLLRSQVAQNAVAI